MLFNMQDMFLGEILGAVVFGSDHSLLNPVLRKKAIKIVVGDVEMQDGETLIDEKRGKWIEVLENVNPKAYYDMFAKQLGNGEQSAVIGSFNEQKRIWSRQSNSKH